MDVWGPLIWNVGQWCQQWIPVLAPAGVFVAAWVAYLAYRQQLAYGKREQWWARAQWAIDAAFNPNEDVQLVGLIVLTSLKTSNLATFQDVELFNSIARGFQVRIVERPALPAAPRLGEGGAPVPPSLASPSGGAPAPRGAAAAQHEPAVHEPTAHERRLLAQAERLLAADAGRSGRKQSGRKQRG